MSGDEIRADCYLDGEDGIDSYLDGYSFICNLLFYLLLDLRADSPGVYCSLPIAGLLTLIDILLVFLDFGCCI
jgi:hypothetical protein